MDCNEEFEHKGLRVRIIRDEEPMTPEDGDIPVYLVHFHRQFMRCPDEVPFSNSREGGLFLQEYQEPSYSRDWDGMEEIDDGEDDREDNRTLNAEEWERYDELHAEWAVFLVDSYIHSGVHLTLSGSLEAGQLPDRRWDVSQCGAILIKKDGEWGGDRLKCNCCGDEVPHEPFDSMIGDVERLCSSCGGTMRVWTDFEKIAKQHIEAWNQYLSGDVWGYVVEHPVECNRCGHVEYEELESCWGFYGLERCKEEATAAAERCVNE